MATEQRPSGEPARRSRGDEDADRTRNPARSFVRSEVRSAVRWFMDAATYAGVFWGGGYCAEEALMEVRPMVRRQVSASERRFDREVARGIADLERLLEQQSRS